MAAGRRSLAAGAAPSPAPSRVPAHDSGSVWIASPSPYRTCTVYLPPAFPAHPRLNGWPMHFPTDASPVPSRARARLGADAATPSSYGTLTLYSLPVHPDATESNTVTRRGSLAIRPGKECTRRCASALESSPN